MCGASAASACSSDCLLFSCTVTPILFFYTEEIILFCGQDASVATLSQEYMWFGSSSFMPCFIAETAQKFLVSC